MLDFLIPLYLAGLFACGAQGYNNTNGHWSTSVILFAAFGGGIVRDGAVLHCAFAVLSLEAIPEICIAWLGALLQAQYATKHILKLFLFFADSFGVATFVIIGASAAQSYECGPIMTWVCGIVTSLGGGILSGWLSGLQLRDILSKNVTYRCIAVAATTLYIFWSCTGTSLLEAQCAVVLLTGISNLVLSEWFQKLLRCFIQKQVSLMAPVKYATTVIVLPPYLWQKGEYIHYRASRAYALHQQPWLHPQYHLMQPA